MVSRLVCRLGLLAALMAGLGIAQPTWGQGSSIAYQGHLTQAGAPAEGSFDLRFALYQAALGGGSIGPLLTLPAVSVRNGSLKVDLDFGPGAFDGQPRWLEIQVRPASKGTFNVLTPRQSLSAVPYALYAMTPAGPPGAPGPVGDKGDKGDKGDPGTFPKIGPMGINVPSPLSTVGLQVAPPAGSQDALLLGGNAQGTLMVMGQTASNQGDNYIGSIKTRGTWGELQLNPHGSTVSVGRNEGADLEVNGAVKAMRFEGDGSRLNNVPGTLGTTTTVVAWGADEVGQSSPPAGLRDVTAIAAGYHHVVALKSNGTVVGWGANNFGQTIAPPDLKDVIAIAAGDNHTLALKSDGTVVAWGGNNYGQTNVPPDLRDVIQIAANGGISVALKQDGTVIVWGDRSTGPLKPPAELSGVVGISAGVQWMAALKKDGTVVEWGLGNFPTFKPLVGAKSISMNINHGMALMNDGTLEVATEDPSDYDQPTKLKDLVAVAAGYYHSVVLRSDGTVFAWGRGGGITLPPGLSGVTAIAAGDNFTVAIKRTPVINNDLFLSGSLIATTFNTTSDREAKEGFKSLDPQDVLNKVAALPITQWNFKGQPGEQHVGPMAQDFRAVFGLGHDERHIATVDADGIALAAIQGLNQKLERENDQLRREMDQLKAALLRLKQGDFIQTHNP